MVDVSHTLFDRVRIVGATARLTRFVTRDSLSLHHVHEPLDNAMIQWWREHRPGEELPIDFDDETKLDLDHPSWPKVFWYRTGLDCPWCVGFWIALGVEGLEAVYGTKTWWRTLTAGLALNYAVAHIGSALGDYDDEADTLEHITGTGVETPPPPWANF